MARPKSQPAPVVAPSDPAMLRLRHPIPFDGTLTVGAVAYPVAAGVVDIPADALPAALQAGFLPEDPADGR